MRAADGQSREPLDVGDDGWVLEYIGVDPEVERVRETLCTLGNGYVASRGAAPESSQTQARQDGAHYPGTYVAGLYNRLRSRVPSGQSQHSQSQHSQPRSRRQDDESLVNLPNWLALGWRIGRGRWVVPDGPETREYQQRLDLRTGVLNRRYRHVDGAGKSTTVVSRALVSMAAPHLAALETTFIAENWSGELQVRSGIDGRVANRQVAEYAPLAGRHLRAEGQGSDGPGRLWLRTRTSQSRVEVAVATRTRVSAAGSVGRRSTMAPGGPEEMFTIAVQEGQPVRVEKVAALYTSRDRAITEPVEAAQAAVVRAGSFEELLAGHAREWHRLWQRCHVELQAEGPDHGPAPLLALNLHTFHLLACTSPNVVDLDTSVGARGLHGEVYRGHVFWDELFIHRFLVLHLPEVSRALLLYRWRRLEAARGAAAAAGHQGAMFPWESGSDGREETPGEVFNPRLGRWMRAHTDLQRHVGLAIAYNVWQYYQATADADFMRSYGAEMLIEIARFFADLAERNEATGRYEITGVVGPDEYHTTNSDSHSPGLSNNAYTNVMAVWLLRRALEVVDLLDCDVDQQEIARWQDITTRMYVPFLDDCVISQFDGYASLPDLDLHKYAARCGGDLSRLDALLAAEGDSPNNYRLGKQADVVMLLYLLSTDELRDLLSGLGYEWPAAAVPRTVRFYLDRVVHGSSLSRVVYAWVQARSDRTASWRLFTKALSADIGDTQHGSTRDGVHLGAMAGTLDLAERCYLGVEIREDALWLNPRLPQEVAKLHTLLTYRGHQIHVTASQQEMVLTASPCNAAPVTVHFAGRPPVQLSGGQKVTIR